MCKHLHKSLAKLEFSLQSKSVSENTRSSPELAHFLSRMSVKLNLLITTLFTAKKVQIVSHGFQKRWHLRYMQYGNLHEENKLSQLNGCVQLRNCLTLCQLFLNLQKFNYMHFSCFTQCVGYKTFTIQQDIILFSTSLYHVCNLVCTRCTQDLLIAVKGFVYIVLENVALTAKLFLLNQASIILKEFNSLLGMFHHTQSSTPSFASS